jgi:hypothetical protein
MGLFLPSVLRISISWTWHRSNIFCSQDLYSKSSRSLIMRSVQKGIGKTHVLLLSLVASIKILKYRSNLFLSQI